MTEYKKALGHMTKIENVHHQKINIFNRFIYITVLKKSPVSQPN